MDRFDDTVGWEGEYMWIRLRYSCGYTIYIHMNDKMSVELDERKRYRWAHFESSMGICTSTVHTVCTVKGVYCICRVGWRMSKDGHETTEVVIISLFGSLIFLITLLL